MSPGEVILSGSMLLAMPLALLAGVISFLSPCVLPLVPGYLGYVAGNAAPKSRVMLGATLFVLGFTTVFVSLGVVAGTAGLLFITRNPWVQALLGLLVIILGLVMIGRFGFMQRTFKLPISPKTGLWGAPLLGVVFALGWTPCIGPTLAAVLVMASDSGDPARGAILATIYSLGMGIPFILIAAGFGWATKSVDFLKRHLRALNLFGGGLLIVIGVLIATGLWSQLMTWFLGVTSGFQLIL
ncbi:cytochrome c biogenesis CcdA family protein [Candidatus Aquiluna sp. UB-MaderosW2red]|uniref:cytochrome c biogenesis CcdA family protein n=1 Tax=Candidatus Aquiluna sp. UB-MaderosW2red TaxID=1855377 RepID=UPI000875BC92|nr:cytochrome c biogenesis protein CcdA [Candidatus Aquiluna sp. UB-MaderosW2red]SCX02525.1 cytochrome c-type biogenesis protein [Candidatus Aquiluna sp. UB-MaderosW2red]